MTDTPPVVARNLCRRFGDVQAVDDVSFTVRAGEVFGLLGPNGAGKTTCLRMLVTLIPPDRGSASVGGFDVATQAEDVKRSLGFHTGDTRLYERLTPRETLRYFGRLHGMGAAALESRIDLVLDEIGASEFRDRLCGELSTGQMQRVSLARALLHDPPVLVLDEPTSGLDIVSAQYIVELLAQEASRGKAIIMSTHILAEAELICHRIGVMHQGRLAATGSRAELMEATGQPSLIAAFLQLVGSSEERATAGDIHANEQEAAN